MISNVTPSGCTMKDLVSINSWFSSYHCFKKFSHQLEKFWFQCTISTDYITLWDTCLHNF